MIFDYAMLVVQNKGRQIIKSETEKNPVLIRNFVFVIY